VRNKRGYRLPARSPLPLLRLTPWPPKLRPLLTPSSNLAVLPGALGAGSRANSGGSGPLWHQGVPLGVSPVLLLSENLSEVRQSSELSSSSRRHHDALIPLGILHLGTQNLPLPCRWHQLSLVRNLTSFRPPQKLRSNGSLEIPAGCVSLQTLRSAM
jgi:hypothetical protein